LRSVIVVLLEANGLQLVADAHVQRLARRRDAELPIAHAPRQVEGLLRRPLQRQPQRVLRYLRSDCVAHHLCRREEAVSRHRPVQRLVRTLEVVVLHEELQSPLAVAEVGKHRPRQEFVPERLPESFHLPQRLWMLRPALHVADPLPP
jgi:hypothetical protein